MPTPLHQLALAAREARRKKRIQERVEESRKDAARLRNLLADNLGIVMSEPLEAPIHMQDGLLFTLDKVLSDSGSGYDYWIVAGYVMEEDANLPAEQVIVYGKTRIRSLADLGEKIAVATPEWRAMFLDKS